LAYLVRHIAYSWKTSKGETIPSAS